MQHNLCTTVFTISYFVDSYSHVIKHHDSVARTSYEAEIEVINHVFDEFGTTPIIVFVVDQNGRHYNKGVNRVVI